MKRLLTLMVLVSGMVLSAFAQTAILVRDTQPVSIFYGAAALTNAVNSAEATGDIIVLSSGTFSNPGEIKKSVSIYGQGHEGANRSYIQGKLSLRPSEVGSIDNIHLEGLYLENHFNILNDGDRSPISNLSVVKCHITGMFLYMPSNNVVLRNCIIQGDLKTYPSSYTATNMLIENCWKDGGSFNIFTSESTIAVRNCIFHCRSISGFDNSSTYIKASFENCILSGCALSSGTSATNCMLLDVNASASGLTTTDCWVASSASDVFQNADTPVYSEGAVPVAKSNYVGTDNTPVGITGGNYPWSVVPDQPTINFETTLTKDVDGFYKIGSVEDWRELKRVVESINPCVNAKMTADINLEDDQTAIGNGDYNVAANRRPFMGIFDGQGHTLTINYNTADWEAKTYLGAAPFAYVWNGTIRNLNTAGTITATQEGVAGLVGWTNGSTLIERCHSSVDITYTNEKRGAAGLTYNSYSDSHVLTIADCIYDGTLTAGSNKTGSSGFVVYRSSGTVNISNSLSVATYGNGMGSSDCATFVRNPSGTISNCHFLNPLNLIQGNQATANEIANGRTAFYLQAGRADLVWGQEIGVDPQPVLTNDESKRVYRSADGYTNDPSLANADQSLVPLLYTRNANNELTVTGFDPAFMPAEPCALVIPDNVDGSPVVAVANSAFLDKKNISSVYIGKNVKSIGEQAFRNVTTMTSLTFAPEGQLTTLSTNSFRNCSSLEAVIIPNTVTTMGTSVFEDCSGMTSAAFEEGFTMTYIPEWTFYNTRFTSFEIPASVNTINKGVFMNNTALAAIEFPATLTKLGQEAFHNCSSLTEVTIPATITAMDANTFQNSGVVTAEVYCAVMGQGVFYQCANLESVNIHEGVTTIGLGTFHGCTKLPEVIIPSTVTKLLETAFRDCTSLTSVTFAEGSQLTSIGNAAFYNDSQLPSIDIPATVTTINNDAFGSCAKLVAVNFAADTQLASIGSSAFANCAILPSFIMPNTVTTIGNSTFYNCPLLESVTLSNQLTAIPDEAFRLCTSLDNMSIPRSVTRLGTNAFRACSSLSSIVIPNTVTAMGTSVFEDCSGLTSASIEEGFTITTLPDWTFYNTRFASFIIPPSIETIGRGVFQKNSALTSITIPNTVVSFAGIQTFRECTSLTEAIFEEPCQVTSFPNEMFYETGLQSITIPASVVSLGNNSFYNCKQLEEVTFPQGLTTIGNSAFRYCETLNNVVLPSTLTSIQDWSFANCVTMENLTLEEGITSINRDVFQYSGMKNVVLPSTIGTIGINLFYQCNQLETLDVSRCVNVWDLYNYTTLRGSNTIFYGVPATTKIIMPPYGRATLGANDEMDTESFDLTQDDEGYYLIKNADDWDKFVVYSRTNPTINGRLTADIDLTGHVGKVGVGNSFSQYNTYKGTFDGQYHTVKVNYSTNKEITGGMFSWVEGANILRLTVEGDIESGYMHVGGFVGGVITGVTMNDCESRVTITGKTLSSKNMGLGGFVGHGGNQYAIQLTDCLFSGKIGGGTNVCYVAPFMAWTDNSTNTVYTNCLSNGTFETNTSSTHRLGDGKYTVAVSCFYKEGNYSNSYVFGTPVSVSQLASGTITYRLQGSRTEQHWGQLLGTDPAPRLTNEEGTRVYRGQTYTNEYVEYTGLQKDENDYYLIGGTADWEEFCLLVEEFPLANARMIADVEVVDNSMVGTSANPYAGIFDGQGHKLSVNYAAFDNYCAPFRYISGATIKNLHTIGSISSSYRFLGGVAASTKGTNTIQNCWSSIDMVSSYNGDGTNGGIAAYNENGTLNLDDCLFDGSMAGTSTYSWAGLVGWRAGAVNLNNCLVAPVSVDINEYSGATLVRNGATITNCYYSRTINNNVQGTEATAEQLVSGEIAYKLQNKRTDFIWGQCIGEDAYPVLFNNVKVYRTIEGYSNTPDEGDLVQDTDGYYLIGNVEDWRRFAMYVDDGFVDINVRMTADIDLGLDQTMIGSGTTDPDSDGSTNIKYQGVFDGNGHSLKINYVATEHITAPFRFIENATIKNLHVWGSITTAYRNAGGIVGICFGQQIHSYIENCVSSVHIFSSYVNTGDFYGGAWHGGITARLHYYGQLHITDCVFDGSIRGENSRVVWGGMLGIPDGTVTITNCLQLGEFLCSGVIGGGNGSGTFSTLFNNGYASRVNIGNCYYLNALGNVQGTQATEATLADGSVVAALQAGREEEIWVLNPYTNQPMLWMFCEDYDPDGIVSPLGKTEEGTIYNLSGQRLNKTQKGINIVNGRKVLVK